MMKESELVEKVRQTINEADDDSAVTLLTPDRRSFDDNIRYNIHINYYLE